MTFDTSGGHPEMDYREHIRTYRGFVRGTQIIVAGVVILLALMAAFLI